MQSPSLGGRSAKEIRNSRNNFNFGKQFRCSRWEEGCWEPSQSPGEEGRGARSKCSVRGQRPGRAQGSRAGKGSVWSDSGTSPGVLVWMSSVERGDRGSWDLPSIGSGAVRHETLSEVGRAFMELPKFTELPIFGGVWSVDEWGRRKGLLRVISLKKKDLNRINRITEVKPLQKTWIFRNYFCLH